jgi:hypothetical protein
MQKLIIVRQVLYIDEAYLLAYEVGEDVYEAVPKPWAVALGLADNRTVKLERALGRLVRARRHLSSSPKWPPVDIHVRERKR